MVKKMVMLMELHFFDRQTDPITVPVKELKYLAHRYIPGFPIFPGIATGIWNPKILIPYLCPLFGHEGFQGIVYLWELLPDNVPA
jgi:hypothetical protein